MAQKSTYLNTKLLAAAISLAVLCTGCRSTDDKVSAPSTPKTTTPNHHQDTLNLASQPTQASPKSDAPVPKGKLLAAHGNPAITTHLVALPSRLTIKKEMVHADVRQPLMAMINAAAQDGIKLKVVSAYRSHTHQKQIWEKKWGNAPQDSIEKALEILQWSSFPGTSRHHWGTDIDFNDVTSSYWQTGEGAATYQWLQANAGKFGFCQTYGPNRNKGYQEEPWHWSHMPTAQLYFAQISHPNSLETIVNQGVKGSTAIRQIPLIDYITIINTCQQR